MYIFLIKTKIIAVPKELYNFFLVKNTEKNLSSYIKYKLS